MPSINNISSDNANNKHNSGFSEDKVLTFKDWKTLKDNRNKSNNAISLHTNNNTKHKSCNNNTHNAIAENKTNFSKFNIRNPNAQVLPNFFVRNDTPSGITSFNSCSRVTKDNVFGLRGKNFEMGNSGYHNFNGANSNFNSSSNLINSLGSVRSRLNLSNTHNYILPDHFFASDGFYRQKDLMQKPLLNRNPFRNERKAIRLLREFDKSRCVKEDKIKKRNRTLTNSKNSPLTREIQTASGKLANYEAKIYVPNPKTIIDGKSYLPKPKLPEQNLEITKEEKKQQWKEYREAMKPFKNREFYNAKRVVQRLGKKGPNDLNEKEVIRLSNAREIMAAHKARLSAKYANYIKSENSSNELGELYVLKKPPNNKSDFSKPLTKQFRNYGNFGKTCSDFELGRKIVGDHAGFVAGRVLESAMQRLITQ